jgi:protease-4
LVVAAMARGEAAPATRPATQAASHPATAPATRQAKQAFPTPAELIAKIRQMEEEKARLIKVAHIHLSGPIVEKPLDFSLFGNNDAPTLGHLIGRLHQARDDQDIRAVVITISGVGMSMAQAQEVRDALAGLRRAGKLTFVYADSYDTVTYTLASGATNICMLEGGEILIPGVGIEATFAKGLLDKIGVQADYVQIGEYKGADEAFTRTGPSDQLRGELNKLMDAYYGQIVDGVSLQRNLAPETVKQMIDEAMISGKAALQRGLVDHLVDQDGLRPLIAEELGGAIDIIARYGLEAGPDIDFSSPWSLLGALAKKEAESELPKIAVVYVDGAIVDGEGGGDLFGGSYVGSETMRRALRMALRDEDVKAVVLRIDSPGGSALASEAIWQAVRRLAKEKPVVVSIGSMAASGGYYIAVAGETIFADRSAIVGSIGVVGGKFVTKELYEKLGLSTEAFTRGRNADLFSSSQPFNDRQRRMITNWMKATYEQFTDRVMTTRKGKIKDIDKVARGRIFLASEAKALGMVDEIGGLHEATLYAAGKVGLEEGEFDLKLYPRPKTFADLIRGDMDEAASPLRPVVQVSPDSALAGMPEGVRRTVMQQVMLLRLLEERPVILAMPYTIRLR